MAEYFLIGDHCVVAVDGDMKNDSQESNKIYLNGCSAKGVIRSQARELLTIFLTSSENGVSRLTIEDIKRALGFHYRDIRKNELNTNRVSQYIHAIREAIRDENIEDENNYKYLSTLKGGGGYQLLSKRVQTLFSSCNPDFLNRNEQIYIPRDCEQAQVASEAFKNKNIHAIRGEAGIGKTVFSREFAKTAYKKGNYQYILFTRYEDSLEKTISNIPTYVHLAEFKSFFEQNISFLKDLSSHGKTLLIIDNYENLDYKTELSEDNYIYNELLNTKCDILLTTRTDISDCYIFENSNHITMLSSIGTEALVEHFQYLSGIDSDKEAIAELIDTCLLGNTYLVCLSAKLAKEIGVHKVIDAFESLRVSETKPVNHTKDGIKQDSASIYEHYSKFLKNHALINDTKYHKILFNLAFLPIDGLEYDDFFSLAFEKKEREEQRKLFKTLKDFYIVFEQYGKVLLHPLMKEFILKEIKFREEYIEKYYSYLCKKLYVTTYEAGLLEHLILGESMLKSMEVVEASPLNKAYLASLISSGFDILDQKEPAYDYGIFSYEIISSMEVDALSSSEKFIVAKSLNLSGYSIMHIGNCNREIAEDVLLKAKTISEFLSNTLDKQDSMCFENDILQLKIIGNLGAFYQNSNVDFALKYHIQALPIRERIYSENPNKKNGEMLAVGKRGIATDYFIKSKKTNSMEEKLEFLKLSYEYNSASVKLYEQYNRTPSLDTVVGYSRLSGTLLTIMELTNDDKVIYDITHESFFDLVEKIYNYMQISVEFLTKLDAMIEKEIEGILSHIRRLDAVLAVRSCVNYCEKSSIMIKDLKTFKDLPEDSVLKRKAVKQKNF